MCHRLLLCVAVVAASMALVAADKPGEDDIKSATRAVEERLKDFKSNVGPKRIESDALASALPKYHAFAVMFAQWPLPVPPPDKLQSSNLFVAGPDGKVTI